MAKRPLLKRLNSEQGETLAEALVAILVSSMAMLMLSTAISGSFRIIDDSNKAIKTYYEGLSALANHVSESSTNKLNVTISAGTESVSINDVPYYEDRVGSKPVVAYGN